MRVAHLAPQAGLEGGVAAYVRTTLPLLATRDVEVVVCTPRDAAPFGIGEEHRFDTPADLQAFLGSWGAQLVHHHHAIPEALTGLAIPAVRTVHAHSPYCFSGRKFYNREQQPCGVTAGPVPCATGYLVHRCGSLEPKRLARRWTIHRQERRSRPLAIALSRFVEEQLLATGYPRGAVRRLDLPVHLPADPPVRTHAARASVLFAGRITDTKGLLWLVRAIAATDAAVHLDVAGDGPGRGPAERLAADLGVADRVHLHGWVDQARLASLRAAATVAVVPSIWHEPAGLVPLEAMAAGLPTIVSRTGALTDLEERAGGGVVGVVVNDVDGLARAVADLVADPDRAARMASLGRALLERDHRPDHHADALVEIYREALSATEPDVAA